LARLQAAGVQVDVGLMAAESQELNIGFFKRMQQGTPWLRMKSAQSLDGQTALINGQSQWITGEAARLDGHRFRAQACAVLTGIGTVLEDNPLLNVRGINTPRQPYLLLVDSRLQTPLDARLWEVNRSVVIFHAERHPAVEEALKAKGAQLVCLPGEGQKVDLAAMVRHLGQLPCNEIHIEAGHKLNGSLLKAGLVDELLVYVAPVLLGPGQAMAALPELQTLPSTGEWVFTDHTVIGSDLRVRLRAVR
jgi:diaminohydroxyphosphoribosylaminopyrimidine deaminase/5-amino-6-(5-phosphoribosylamino)uracil reductase